MRGHIKPLLIGLGIVILASVVCLGIYEAFSPKVATPTIIVPKPVKIAQKAPTPTVYGIGDTQNGITLIGEYHTSYQNMRSANPTVPVVAFAISGVDQGDVWQYSAVNTISGFVRTDQQTVPECGTNACAVFEGSEPTQFYYKNLVWQL